MSIKRRKTALSQARTNLTDDKWYFDIRRKGERTTHSSVFKELSMDVSESVRDVCFAMERLEQEKRKERQIGFDFDKGGCFERNY